MMMKTILTLCLLLCLITPVQAKEKEQTLSCTTWRMKTYNHRMIGGTQWGISFCNDDKSLMLNATKDNPAYPSTIKSMVEDGKRIVSMEVHEDYPDVPKKTKKQLQAAKKIALEAQKALEAMTEEEIAALIQELKIGKE